MNFTDSIRNFFGIQKKEKCSSNPCFVINTQTGGWLESNSFKSIIALTGKYDYDNEIGGLIYGNYEGDNIIINSISKVNNITNGSKYKPDVSGLDLYFSLIKNYAKGIKVIGNWHTHPPDKSPYPSASDLETSYKRLDFWREHNLAEKYLMGIFTQYQFAFYLFYYENGVPKERRVVSDNLKII